MSFSQFFQGNQIPCKQHPAWFIFPYLILKPTFLLLLNINPRDNSEMQTFWKKMRRA